MKKSYELEINELDKVYPKHYVYRHIRIDENKPFYIGIGTKNRFENYARAFSKTRNMFWKKIVDKTEIRVDIIFESNNYEEVIEKEKEFIKIYGKRTDGGLLCNLTDGGEGLHGWIPSEATRLKFRNRQLGKKPTKQELENMSIAQKKRYQINGVSPKAVPVYQYDINGVFLKKHLSITHAYKELKCSHSNLFRAVNKENSYAMGSFWFYKYKGTNIIPTKSFILHSKIAKIDIEGNIICIYKSISEACWDNYKTRTGLNHISDVCKGKKESYNGMKWRYYFD